jgi:peptidoglycan/LPS O-acetylase OafA/YrhL
MKNIKVFEGFGGLRFFAAYLVLLYHLESAREKYQLYNWADFPLFHKGPFAVEFFFVLSGFLITYLLFKEDAKSGTIDIKKFYVRRILRIWPLYYIIVILGIFVVPFLVSQFHVQYDKSMPVTPYLWLYIAMLPNLATILFGSNFMYPLWSIGVEEQFYLFWAPVFRSFKDNLPTFLVGVIIARHLFYFLEYAGVLVKTDDPFIFGLSTHQLYWFFETQMFECMAVGALGAYYVYYYGDKLKDSFVFSTWFQIIIYSALLFLLLIDFEAFKTNIVANTIINNSFLHSLIFLPILLNVSLNTSTIFTFKNRVLEFLGEISYGIYMYHTVLIQVGLGGVKNMMRNLHPALSTVFIYCFFTGLTVLVAYCSYRFVEKPLLHLKDKFQTYS